jgi:hypothetical protein
MSIHGKTPPSDHKYRNEEVGLLSAGTEATGTGPRPAVIIRIMPVIVMVPPAIYRIFEVKAILAA